MLPGQWPWFVAIYSQRLNTKSYGFMCTGSILITRHILTIIDCIILFGFMDVYVAFGQLTSRRWPGNHTGIVTRAVADFKVKADLAILILKTAVEYNAFIMPIRLWSGSTNLQDIFNMTGYVVGWGYLWPPDGAVTYTRHPRMGKVTLRYLKEHAICEDYKVLYSHPAFKTNVCDTGAGFVVFNIFQGWVTNISIYPIKYPGFDNRSLARNAGFSLWNTKYVS